MSRGLARVRTWAATVSVACLGVLAAGCEDSRPAGPDARIELYSPVLAAEDGAREAERAYLGEILRAHEQADAALAAGDEASARARLAEALAHPVAAGDRAAIVRLDLAARYGELQTPDADGASETIRMLEPLLAIDQALPIDSATARALVVLGDAASRVDDHALAAGSYARSVRVMSKLRSLEAERLGLGDADAKEGAR